jgi:fluoroquinolone transport system ATP-binding protein
MGDVDELCDRVAFITDGKLVEVDSPRNLKLKYGKRTVAVEYRDNGNVVKEVFTMDQIREQAFMDLIASKNIETIHSGETTLEEIFIQVTGVKLHGED